MPVFISPELDQARSELAKALEARMMVTMVANCTVSYSGRTGSDMGEGERLVVLKGDGCVLVHRGRDYQPVNWQPSGCVIQTRIESGHLILKAVRPSPLETLTIEMGRIGFLAAFHLKDQAGAAAVKQLAEYLKYLSPAEGKKLRPIIVAPSLAKGVLPMVEKMRIEFKPLTLQKSLETLQKHTKSDQKALKSWLGQIPVERN